MHQYVVHNQYSMPNNLPNVHANLVYDITHHLSPYTNCTVLTSRIN
uniref:Uncharacterized protein n=1 Tax=Schistosoma curassoni TaxID=6186 RepID=A0A183L0I8_9TREM